MPLTESVEHLVAFGFVYPAERHRVPPFVMRELISRLQDESAPGAPTDPSDADVCRGTLLSRLQYLIDLRERGYRDAREQPVGAMTRDQIEAWTRRAEQEAVAAMPAHLQPPKPEPTRRRSS